MAFRKPKISIGYQGKQISIEKCAAALRKHMKPNLIHFWFRIAKLWGIKDVPSEPDGRRKTRAQWEWIAFRNAMMQACNKVYEKQPPSCRLMNYHKCLIIRFGADIFSPYILRRATRVWHFCNAEFKRAKILSEDITLPLEQRKTYSKTAEMFETQGAEIYLKMLRSHGISDEDKLKHLKLIGIIVTNKPAKAKPKPIKKKPVKKPSKVSLRKTDFRKGGREMAARNYKGIKTFTEKQLGDQLS